MAQTLTLAGLAAAYIFATLWIARALHRAAAAAGSITAATQRVADTIEAQADAEPGTDPIALTELRERVETAERRVEGIADDITKRYRKLAQERRRIEAVDDEADGPDPATVAQLRAELAGANGHTQAPAPDTRRRLVPRNRR